MKKYKNLARVYVLICSACSFSSWYTVCEPSWDTESSLQGLLKLTDTVDHRFPLIVSFGDNKVTEKKQYLNMGKVLNPKLKAAI